jgi:hypothetical protein
VELPEFEPTATSDNAAHSALSPEEPEAESSRPAQQSAWTSQNPALMAPCCCRKTESSYTPHRPGKDQCQPDDDAIGYAQISENNEFGPWPEPIGRAEQVLLL